MKHTREELIDIAVAVVAYAVMHGLILWLGRGQW